MPTATEKEPIRVIATFGEDGFFPRIIGWGKKSYKILTVNLVHTIKEGSTRIYFFSVSDEGNSFKLGFNTDTLEWWIEDHYSLAEQ